MPLRVALSHRTTYRYDRDVTLSPHEIRLRPAPHCRTPILAYSLAIEPRNHFLNWQQDPYGNYVARVVFPERTAKLDVTVDLVAELAVFNPFDFFVEPYAEAFPFAYAPTLAKELAPFLEPSEGGDALEQWVARFRAGMTASSTVDALVAVNQALKRDIAYVLRMEPGVQAPDETLELARGSCRDSAWLLVQVLRRLGVAARFASGYLIQLVPDVPPLDGAPMLERDFTDLHAWAEAYVPGAGWIGLDPTSGLLAGEGHVPLACTASPGSAAPITGLADIANVEFGFTMRVARVDEVARVTRPYSDPQWEAIETLGEHVDSALRAGDIRLTQGGEPTFVAIDRVDAPEWNTTALSATKLECARRLVRRLKQRFAPQGLLHEGQGKWYPGEPLPRWALGLFWCTDGAPLWRDEALLADAAEAGSATLDEARNVIVTLAERLRVDARNIVAVDEARGSDVSVIGFVLPLRARENANDPERWTSCTWPASSDGRLRAIAGDSPLGLRLPLASIPEDAPLRTALAVEVRNGQVAVFVPPIDRVDDYGALIATIEATASALRRALLIEGYPPPRDPRIRTLFVTPDPGVLEVNVPPATTWRELVDLNSALYEEARLARLTTEKFMLDGRHVGTGGGNHVTLGGASVQESPLLRRPDLLQSLVAYWQTHPALSFLFSGHFVGPTSQAPRVDEARDDCLYELAIAFQQLDGLPAWDPEAFDVAHRDVRFEDHAKTVDRLLRHLLTDLTGNTHRAEFSIDKLYSPDTSTGRLGLLEFRAFEMPPHPRMAAVQMLLLRALVARFWQAPYRAALIPWGTALHDRWMLPHFVVADLLDVLADLRAHGFDFSPAWFDAFIEFRFPRYGSVAYDGLTLELREAIEPWHVLGEEIHRGGTSRYVDSSVERLQVKATGFTPQRHAITCNDRVLPMTPTAVPGEFVAGVRFKAWNPPSSLHPTIGVQSPLRFTIVDRHVLRAIGGCTYHVAHPGGRSYDTFPVNAQEAEARRIARFTPHGHAGGRIELHDEPPNPATPTTLDLRWNPT
ncbi:MAG TPA: transglutaminase family protein [Casimicrobiaceae bacterium]|nr:transglutaminase family protein [Casimicrobiaceae bacterium]